MRLGVFLVLFMVTFTASCIIQVSAGKTNAARSLKGVQSDGLAAENEERAIDVKTIVTHINGNGGAKASTSGAAAVATAAMQQKALETAKSLKSVGTQTTTGAKKWKKLANAVDGTARFQKGLDTADHEWRAVFTKLKVTNQVKITESQAVKITEAAAKEVAKNPSKWRYVKKFLEISFGVALTALILAGINSMIS